MKSSQSSKSVPAVKSCECEAKWIQYLGKMASFDKTLKGHTGDITALYQSIDGLQGQVDQNRNDEFSDGISGLRKELATLKAAKQKGKENITLEANILV
jgi:hypothetical protein